MNEITEDKVFIFMDKLTEFCHDSNLPPKALGKVLASTALIYLDDNLYDASNILEDLATTARIHSIMLDINKILSK